MGKDAQVWMVVKNLTCHFAAISELNRSEIEHVCRPARANSKIFVDFQRLETLIDAGKIAISY
jgi:hypothetical protein